MAGIGMTSEKKWFAAKWILFYLLEIVKDKFPKGSILDIAIEAGLNDGTNWLNLQEVPFNQLDLFKREIKLIYDDLKQKGASSLASPEFYPGLMERISELVELLEE
jgi:hypothetical protein